MDMIQDGKTYMDAPPELIKDVSEAFAKDSAMCFVRLYHNPKEGGWLPVPCRDGGPVIDLEQETKDANEKGWNYIATLTSHGCGHA